MKTRLIIACVLGMLFTACSRPSDVRRALTKQLENYPESALQDVYKTFYQDRFGPAHMVLDTLAAHAYLLDELEAVSKDSVENPYYEPTGAKGQFVRVYLRGVREGLITEGQLFDAFVRSTGPVEQPEESWSNEWASIVGELTEVELMWLDRDTAQAGLQQAAGLNRAVHHSNAYRQAYHPHYRIVEKTIFEQELRPYLDAHLPVR